MDDFLSKPLQGQVFSLRSFLRETAQDRTGLVALGLPTLSPGLHIISGGPDAMKSLKLVEGLGRASVCRRMFLDQIRSGVIPTAIEPTAQLDTNVQVSLVSTAASLRPKGTLLSLVVDDLGDFVNHLVRAQYRRCSTCAARFETFRTASACLDNITQHFTGQPIVLLLRGASETVERFCREKGFAREDTAGGGPAAFLDTLTLKENDRDRLRGTVELAWSFGGAWVDVSSGRFQRGYSPSGFCNSCLSPAEALDRSVLTDVLRSEFLHTEFLNMPTYVPELNVEVAGATLAEILSMPIEHAAGPLVSIAPRTAERIEDLRSIGLGFLPTGVAFSRLASQTRFALSAVCALHTENPWQLVIIDLPLLFRQSFFQQHLAPLLARRASDRAIVLVCSDSAASEPEAEHQALSSQSSETRPLESLTFNTLLHSDSRSTVLTVSPEHHHFDLVTALSLQLSNRPEEPCSYLTLANAHFRGRSMVIEELELYERVCRLFASSVSARMLGLTPASFKRTGNRATTPGVCPHCRGLGVVFADAALGDRPHSAPCPSCKGVRFGEPISKILFRGNSLSDLLDLTITNAAGFMRTLPRTHEILSLVDDLALGYLPLGFPSALLSFSESRLLRLLLSILSTTNRPQWVVIEEPLAGLSDEQASRVTRVLQSVGKRSQGHFVLVGVDPRLARIAKPVCVDIPAI